MTEGKPKRRATKKAASRAAKKKRTAATGKIAAKKTGAKQAAAKKAAVKKSSAPLSSRRPAGKKAAAKKVRAAKKIADRKSVPIKTARVRKRALLPPLPPPPSPPLKAARSPARLASRAKALGRAKTGVKNGKTLFEIPACTETVLRQKLRLAAPYIELWLAQSDVSAEDDAPTPEAAFVRIWQWLMLEATLDGGHVVITPDLIDKLYAEEMGRSPTA